jgi:hypothetical protein
MKGLVFTGFEVPEKFNKYKLVVYLRNGGYNNGPLDVLTDLYFDSIENNNSDELLSFLSRYGLVNKDLIENIIVRSRFCFISFILSLKGIYPRVFKNFRNSLISQELKKVIEMLRSREGLSVIVGETTDLPYLGLRSYLADLPKGNVLVAYPVTRYCPRDLKNPLAIFIDGNYLSKGVGKEEIKPGIPVLISPNTNGCYVPSNINPKKNRIIMTQDSFDGVDCIKYYAEFDY